jgi:7-carboxy-7-deazaguanine synthase
MRYQVKEIFRTLQGEGGLVGTPMVFLRFAGCNLWSGREEDRAGARCDFCDTDFRGGEALDAPAIVARIEALPGPRWICCTGGEPMLQLDRRLLGALHEAGYQVAIETNGTVSIDEVRGLIDWVCVSPKTPEGELRVREGDELKLIYRGQSAAEIDRLAALPFRHRSLQPEWGARYEAMLAGALDYLRGQATWRLSVQVHKIVGMP